jgi:hypothetical protein
MIIISKPIIENESLRTDKKRSEVVGMRVEKHENGGN